MDLVLFAANLVLAVAGPLLALRYLRPILLALLARLCGDSTSGEFWFRCAQVLALTGTLLLTLAFGDWREVIAPVAMLQHALLLTVAGVFASVAVVSAQVWSQLKPWLFPQGPSSISTRAPTAGATPPAAPSPVISTPLPTRGGQ